MNSIFDIYPTRRLTLSTLQTTRLVIATTTQVAWPSGYAWRLYKR